MAGSPHFEVYQDKAGEWRWRFRAANGKTLADGAEGYLERNKAELAVDRLLDTMAEAPNVEVLA